MGWTYPKTWVDGETLTAPELNTHVRNNMWMFGHQRPGASISRSSGFSIFSGSFTTVQWDSFRWASTGSVVPFNPVVAPFYADRITATQAGLYLVTVTIEWTSNATGTRQIRATSNNGVDVQLCQAVDQAVSGQTHRQNMTFYADMALNGYVYISVFQNSTSTLDVIASNSIFTMTMIHPK
jgi:hypothetical protein